MINRTFKEIWAVDFEFTSKPGHHPLPVCMVAKEILTGRVIRMNDEELRQQVCPPFGTSKDHLFIAYYAAAEFSCFKALGWEYPLSVIDLYVEFLNLRNGLLAVTRGKSGLLDVLELLGLDNSFHQTQDEKDEMRKLAMRGGPWASREMASLIDYCTKDVEALEAIWLCLSSKIDLSALLRGHYTQAVAEMEWNGVPIDTDSYHRFVESRSSLRETLIARVDPKALLWVDGKFDGTRFASWVKQNNWRWPRLPSGRLSQSKDIWSDMAKIHPELREFSDLRNMVSRLRSATLEIGLDGRNRSMLSPFRSKTSRNQPSSTRFIFGCPSWMRGFIQPEPGRALAYIDWSQQEFGIPAILSRDDAMRSAYESGDPYLHFAMMAGAVPPGATRKSHSDERELFKVLVLAVGYGMTAYGLASRLGCSERQAEEYLKLHRKCFPGYWSWSDRVANCCVLDGSIRSRYGWRFRLHRQTNERTTRNFPCQANGAEMMRLAAIHAVSAGIKVCAPVHDAFLIEAAADEIESEVEKMQCCMSRASAEVLQGFELKTEALVCREGERLNKENSTFWKTVMGLCNPS